eukprot:jgi/Psemu1/68480/estExt_Genemark1.C_5120002
MKHEALLNGRIHNLDPVLSHVLCITSAITNRSVGTSGHIRDRGRSTATAPRLQTVKEHYFRHVRSGVIRRHVFTEGAVAAATSPPPSSSSSSPSPSPSLYRDAKPFVLDDAPSNGASRRNCGLRFGSRIFDGRVRSRDARRNFSTSSDGVPEIPPRNNGLSRSGGDSNSNSNSNLVAELQSKLGPEDTAMIDFLMSYKANQGDCHVPTGNTKSAREERSNLGVPVEVAEWVVKQRKQYRASGTKKGRISDSLAARIISLESIGFLWSCREANWQRSYNKLERRHNENDEEGNAARVREQDDPHLHSWIDQQRRAFKKGLMPSERESLLREIDFAFDPNDARWWENYRHLCEYHREHGDTMVPLVDDNKDPNYLGQWVARQRRLHHSDSLTEDRTQALNGIDFSWDPEGESWDNYYNQLCDFYREHNHTRVPKSMGSLWNWVDRQRRSYRKLLRPGDGNIVDDETGPEGVGTLLTKENVQKLSTIGFEWEETSPKLETDDRIKRLMNVTFELSIHDENWAKHFDKLRAFHKAFGHFSVPMGPGEYKELNAWVRHTRYLYNADKLPTNRIKLLDSIGFPWTAEIARWERLYRELVSFHKTHGHTDIPVQKTELYRWTTQQKAHCASMKDDCESEVEADQPEADARTKRIKRLNTLKEIFSGQE